jgi:hypothetical protein
MANEPPITRRRRWVVIGAALAGALLAGAVVVIVSSGDGSDAGPYRNDSRLRLHDVQMLGTHNSYHRRPNRPLLPNESAAYEHPSLDRQLDGGIRSLELDAYNGPDFPVLHTFLVDQESNCSTIADCLRSIDRWSDAHPGHLTLVVLIEPKPLPASSNPVFQALLDRTIAQHGLADWDTAALAHLDTTVRHAFGRKLVTPDEVRGHYPTLRRAIRQRGWPTLARVRGRVLVVLNTAGPTHDRYEAGSPSLVGRAMFLRARPQEPSAAVIVRDTPRAGTISRLVRQHFLVRTRSDARLVEVRADDHTRADTAIRSGATVVSTDASVADPDVGNYVVELPGRAIARCNPVTSPPSCHDRDLENPLGLRHP